MNTLAPLTIAFALAVSGCFGDPRDEHIRQDTFDTLDTCTSCDTDTGRDVTPEPLSFTVQPRWGRDSKDELLRLFLQVPNTIERFESLRRFSFFLEVSGGSGRLEIEVARPRSGESVVYACEVGNHEMPCYARIYPPNTPPIEPGETLAIEVRGETHEVTAEAMIGEVVRTTLVVPALPTDLQTSHLALAGYADPADTIWTATPLLGLVGITAEDAVIHYPGVSSTDPYDPTWQGPQAELVLAIEPDPDAPRAMWLGTAFTGISWFDPGPSATDEGDDVWLHAQPTDVVDDGALEIAQTTIALAPADGGLWIATLNGLYRATRDGQHLSVERAADGAALAVARGDNFVWAGFTTQLDLRSEEDRELVASWPQARSSLLQIDRVSGEQVEIFRTEPVVTALIADGDELWVGTPHGLMHVVDRAVVPVPPSLQTPVGLAIVSLSPARAGGFWLAAYDECGREPGVLWHVQPNTGSVTDYSARGFGEHHFKSVRELPSGDLLVSTLATPMTWDAPVTASGCKPLEGAFTTADTYLLDPVAPTAQARRLGVRP